MGANTNTKAIGLNTQPNELDAPPGSLSVCENMVISRDGVIELDRGFEDYSANLPDFTPAQLLSVGGTAYLHLDGGLWYFDGSNWRRKRGAFGGKFSVPAAMWLDAINGILYAADSTAHVIYSITLATGVRTIVAGRYGASGTADGVGDAARFNSPQGLWGDGSGNLYVSDTNNKTIRKIVIATQTASTFAGTAGASGTIDATGAAARFTNPVAMWGDSAGVIYALDQNAIRKVTYPGAVVTTFAGDVASNGTTDATGTSARFAVPLGLWGDGAGVIYVADGDNSSVRKVTYPGAVVTTFAGLSGTGGSADGTGTAARIQSPSGIVGDGAGALYVSEGSSKRIRKVTYPGAVVTSPLGLLSTAGTVDGIGTAARFANPGTLIGGDAGASIYVADYVYPTGAELRKVYLAQLYVTTIAGAPDAVSSSSQADRANGIVVGPS